MHSHLRWSTLLALLVLLLAACGDDGPDDAATDADAGTGDEAPEEPEDEPEVEPAEEGDEADGGNGDFEELLAEGSSVRIAITYEGEDDLGESFRMTWAQDPPAIAMSIAAPDGEGRVISPGDGSFITCGLEGGNWDCMRMELLEEHMAGDFLGAAAPFMTDGFGLTQGQWGSFDSDTIAGRQARCASGSFVLDLMGSEADGLTEVCADVDTGALLRVYSESGGDVLARFEAIEVGDPDASMFEPPAEPMDLEGFTEFLEDFDPEDFDPEDFEDFDPGDFDQ